MGYIRYLHYTHRYVNKHVTDFVQHEVGLRIGPILKTALIAVTASCLAVEIAKQVCGEGVCMCGWVRGEDYAHV